jgi:hypothetical protein
MLLLHDKALTTELVDTLQVQILKLNWTKGGCA